MLRKFKLLLFLTMFIFIIGIVNTRAQQQQRPDEIYEKILSEHKNMKTATLMERVYKKRQYINKLSFDPEKLTYYNQITKIFPLSEEEKNYLRKNGFIPVRKHTTETFGTAYYYIYTKDLPLFISSDSILQALHTSYDEILKELEDSLFTEIFAEMLDEMRTELKKIAKKSMVNQQEQCSDVDIYLTVALNLLKGSAPTYQNYNINKGFDSGINSPVDKCNDKLSVNSLFGNDEKVLEILKKINKHELQSPPGKGTQLYGSERFIDYSQFIPRGHYLKNTYLKRYFRMMMWLGRMDCGFNIIPNEIGSSKNDSIRECRDAIILIKLLKDTGNIERLNEVREIITFMIGDEDSFSPKALLAVIKKEKVDIETLLREDDALRKFQKAIVKSSSAKQMISSQVLMSDLNSKKEAIMPVVLQFFGQRFAVDSFVLNKVTFDSIIFNGEKIQRFKPKGLDVMAALGNQEALKLLTPELQKYDYSSNLFSLISTINSLPEYFWNKNIYSRWLDILRTLDENTCTIKNIPESMKTYAWQMKQLQTQHASWSQLKHDTVLYVKQPYATAPLCKYPVAYVEPYPEFYAKLADYADCAMKLFSNIKYAIKNKQNSEEIKISQINYFKNFTSVMKKLQSMAEKELRAKPFSKDEESFFKHTIDYMRDGYGGVYYDGWYCDLFYNRFWVKHQKRFRSNNGGALAYKWSPEISDVFTDPWSKMTLETAVGNVDFMIIAVDNENYRNLYVGPVYSYYEFYQPLINRLNDDKWQKILINKTHVKRPKWASLFFVDNDYVSIFFVISIIIMFQLITYRKNLKDS